ncbi:MAG: hypothetical protein CL530_09075 [Aequorivita sp.]|nr:hypothetical protein [Aequorivita sp.]|tara:strand:+ start:3333 stop:6209 length:2877 start_codon:yes stop_codon:yes gene_type:complete
MKTITKSMLLLSMLLLGTIANAQEYFGTSTFGDTSIEIPYRSAMDSQGNVYAAGIYSGTITVGSTTVTWAGGNADGFLAKYDNDGNPIWVKSFGGAADDVAIDVAVDANDNLYITGYFQGAGALAFDADPGPGVYLLEQLAPFLSRDCFIIKLDSNGDFVWAKQVSNPAAVANEDSKSIEVDSAGNVYIGGSFNYADFNPDPVAEEIILSTNGGASTDGFLLKLDTDGNFVWVKTFASTGIVQVVDMEFDTNEDLLLTGRFRNTVDLDPNAGTAPFTSNGNDDMFMAKLSADGDFIWGNSFGGSGNDFASTIKNLPSGIYLGGEFIGTVDLDPSAGVNTFVSLGFSDAFLSKFDTDGNYNYSYVLGGDSTNFENFYDIKEGFNGNLYATGQFSGTTDFDNSAAEELTTSNGNSDNFLLELTTSGQYLNHWTIGGSNVEINPQLFFNNNNEILTTGGFRSADVDFDPFVSEDIISTTGNYDVYFSHYNIFNNGNDNCSGAIALACGDIVTGETINDTDSGGNAANDEFFSYTGTGIAQFVTISLCNGTDYDSLIRIYDNCDLSNQLAYNDDSCGAQSEVTFLSDGTSTYFIMIEGYASNEGNFTLEVSCEDLAVNDECENALPIACGETVTGTTVNATVDASAPDCGGVSITAPGVWYEFTDTSGLITDYTISLCAGTDFDSKLTVYSGTCGALVCETANDDSCGLQSEVSFQGDGNTTYYILVHGFDNATGNFTLNVDCAPVPPPNDMIVNAIDVDQVGFPYTDTAVAMPAATTENGSPAGCDLTGANGVWYKFTTNVDGNADATIVSPAGASSVTFYTASDENATEADLTWVDQNSNQCAPGTSASIFTLANQTYYVFVLNTGGITDITIDASVLGVDENILEDFSFYPNPTNNVVNLKAQAAIEKATVFNMLGQRVIEMSNNANTMELNVSSLATGTYIMKITGNGEVGTYKLIKN